MQRRTARDRGYRITSGTELSTAQKISIHTYDQHSMFILTSGLRSARDKAITYFEERLKNGSGGLTKMYMAANALSEEVRRGDLPVSAEPASRHERGGLTQMTDTGLPTRTLGRTGLQVTRLGYGAMSLDNGRLTPVTPEQAEATLLAVLDAGINYIDTSPDYGESEECIGKYISHRRNEFFLASKCGCPVQVPEGSTGHVYTRENIVAGVEQSLRRMHTDYLDVVQFHGSPSRATLEETGAIETLRDLQHDGKVRYIGMSGVLPDLADHIAMGVFDEFQIPYSALQREHETAIAEARRAGAGTVIRGGAVRGAPAPDKAWSVRRLPEVAEERPRTFWERARLDDLLDGAPAIEFTLRFTFSHPDLDTSIVGTANPAHLRANLDALAKGPLPADVYVEALRRLDAAASE